MSDVATRHQDFIDQLRRRYLQEGFDELNPREVKRELNIGYEPDLVLKRDGDVMVVEVKSSSSPIQSDQLLQIKEAVESKPGWHFRFYAIPSDRPAEPDEDAVHEANAALSVSRSFSTEHPTLAAMTLWVSLETAMRGVLTKHGERPSFGTPGTSMARRLRDLGELDDDELRMIIDFSGIRNRAAHGYVVLRDRTPDEGIYELTKSLLSRAGMLEENVEYRADK